MQCDLTAVNAKKISLTALFELLGLATSQADRCKLIHCLCLKFREMQTRRELYDNLRVFVQYLGKEDFQQADFTVQAFAPLGKVAHVSTQLEELFCQLDEPKRISLANLLALIGKKPATNFLLNVIEHAHFRFHVRKHFIKALFWCYKLLPKERLQRILQHEKNAFNRAQLEALLDMLH